MDTIDLEEESLMAPKIPTIPPKQLASGMKSVFDKITYRHYGDKVAAGVPPAADPESVVGTVETDSSISNPAAKPSPFGSATSSQPTYTTPSITEVGGNMLKDATNMVTSATHKIGDAVGGTMSHVLGGADRVPHQQLDPSGSRAIDNAAKTGESMMRKTGGAAHDAYAKAGSMMHNAEQKGEEIYSSAVKKSGEMAGDAMKKSENIYDNAVKKGEDMYESAKQSGENVLESAKQTGGNMYQSAKETSSHIYNTAAKKADETYNEASKMAMGIANSASATASSAANTTSKMTSEAMNQSQKLADNTKAVASDAMNEAGNKGSSLLEMGSHLWNDATSVLSNASHTLGAKMPAPRESLFGELKPPTATEQAEELAIDVKNSINDKKDSLYSSAGTMSDKLKADTADVKQAGSNISERHGLTASDRKPIPGVAAGMADKAMDSIKGVGQGIAGVFGAGHPDKAAGADIGKFGTGGGNQATELGNAHMKYVKSKGDKSKSKTATENLESVQAIEQ